MKYQGLAGLRLNRAAWPSCGYLAESTGPSSSSRLAARPKAKLRLPGRVNGPVLMFFASPLGQAVLT